MSRRRTAVAAAALAAFGAPALSPVAPAGAAFDVVAQWSENEYLAPAGAAAPKAAQLEALPGGRMIAVLLARGDDYGHAGMTVVVSRVREASGAWSAAQVTSTGAPWTGTGAPHGRTFDTFTDSSGRVLAVWAAQAATSGQWPVMSMSRAVAGTWSAPEEVYVARTDGGYGDALEVSFIIPRLVPVGDTVTVAWSSATAMPSAAINTDDDPFRARRWTAGAWGPETRSDGFGTEGLDVAPSSPDNTRVKADPVQAVRAGDGRISFVYTLVKHQAIRTVAHPMNPPETTPGEVNLPDVWDGVPEPRNGAHTETAWVIHLDPAEGSWGPPMKLLRSGGVPTSCSSDLPANPPLVAHWAEWKADSEAGELSTSCGYSEESTRPSASYAPGGDLRISLDYRSSPLSEITLNQYLDKACDDPSPGDTYRFCFDDWGAPDWAVEWDDASVLIPAGSDRPGLDAIQESPWAFSPEEFAVSTSAGNVRVVEGSGVDGKAILFDRVSGTDVTWVPDPENVTSDKVNVLSVFASDGDVAVFYTYGSEDGGEGCGLAVLRAGRTVVDRFTGCVAGAAAQAAQRDAVQLPNGRLARVDGFAGRVPVRLFAVTAPPPPPPGPSPVPVPTTFTQTAAPSVKGTPKIGRLLKARPGTWQPAPATVRYRWLLGKKAIKKATKPKLRVKRAWKGKRLAVRITVSRAGVATKILKVKVKGKVRR